MSIISLVIRIEFRDQFSCPFTFRISSHYNMHIYNICDEQKKKVMTLDKEKRKSMNIDCFVHLLIVYFRLSFFCLHLSVWFVLEFEELKKVCQALLILITNINQTSFFFFKIAHKLIICLIPEVNNFPFIFTYFLLKKK